MAFNKYLFLLFFWGSFLSAQDVTDIKASIDMGQLIKLFKTNPQEFTKRLKTLKGIPFKRQLVEDHLKKIMAQSSLDYDENMEGQFLLFLQVVDQLFPKAKICSRYFYGCHTLAPIPSVEGLDFLVEKMNVGDVKAIPLDKLEKAVQSFAKKAEKSGATLEKGFLVWHGTEKDKKLNPTKVDKHITPLFLKAEAGTIQGVILDSVINLEGKTYHHKIEEVLLQALPQKVKENKLEIFQLKPFEKDGTLHTARQRDSFSCPIFSVCDFEDHHRDNLFQFLENEKQKGNSILDNPHSGKWIIKALPPASMRNIQSWTALKRYIQEYPKWVENSGLNLSEPFECGQTRSSRIRSVAFEYFAIIVLGAIS